MTEEAALPDRLAVDPRSPYFNGDLLAQGIGILFKGVERKNVEEYCVSEGWIRVSVGATRDRHGNPMTMLLKGEVKPFIKGA